MKIGAEQFYSKINKLFDTYVDYKNVVENTQKALVKHNIISAEVTGIINRSIVAETVEPAILYLILKNMYEAALVDEHIQNNKRINPSELNPTRFFTEIEISQYENYKKIEKQHMEYPIVIEKVLKISIDQFVTIMSAEQIANLYNNNLIFYNKQTQRNTIFKNGIEQININTNSIREITSEMVNKNFIPNFITLNVLQNGKEEIKYDETNLVLSIEKGEINILDGAHRSISLLNAIRQNPDLDLNMGVTITNFDVEKARYYILQEDHKNKINKSFVQSLDPDRLSNIVTKKLNEDYGSELKNRITERIDDINSNKALALFTTISDAIEFNFKMPEKSDAFIVAKFLKDGFSVLMNEYYDEFSREKEEKLQHKSLKSHENMFIGYIALLSRLQDKEDWANIMFNVLNKIDFTEDNPIWGKSNLNLFTKNVTRPVVKNISNYFINLI
jgi:hypothetical protein